MGRAARIRNAPASARSAKRWADCATSSATRARRLRAWESASAIRLPRRSRASARCRRCIIAKSTGRGQVVDSAIYEAVLNMMESLITEYDKAGYIRERTGAILPNIAPSNVYPTSDGSMVLIAANQDTVFQRLTQAMGRSELSQQPEYATHGARGARQKEIDAIIGDWTRTKTCAEVLELMEEFSVPAGLIYRAPEMLEDPHFQAREAIVSVPHPDFGELKMQNVAPKLSRTPGRVRSPSPRLGQHNDDVYRGLLGMNAERYAQLKTAKVMMTSHPGGPVDARGYGGTLQPGVRPALLVIDFVKAYTQCRLAALRWPDD